MKSKIYKALTILICVVSFIDWPVSSNAQKGKVISRGVEGIVKSAEKEGGLFKFCSNATQGAEEGVNKATQRMGEFEAPRPAAGAAAVNAVRRANASDSYNSPSSGNNQNTWQTCGLCEGVGSIEAPCGNCDDGVAYCRYCAGNGCERCDYNGKVYCPSCGGSGVGSEQCNWCKGQGGYYR